MTLRRLRTLVAVADTATFTEAARKLHVTHAAVSQQMQSLENDFGVKLFDRSVRTPEMTPIAHQLVVKARFLISDYDNLLPSVLEDGGLSGIIRLGALRTTLTGLTSRALVVLKARYPEIGLHIRPGLTRTLLTEIERNTLDAAIITKPHLLPVGVSFRELASEPMHLISAVEEPGEDPVLLLTTKPFIRFNRDAVVGSLIDTWINSKRIRVSETMELDSLEAITSMVQANLGVSIVPRLAVAPQEGVHVKYVGLGDDAPSRTIGLAYRDDHVKKQAVDAIYDALRNVLSNTSTNSEAAKT